MSRRTPFDPVSIPVKFPAPDLCCLWVVEPTEVIGPLWAHFFVTIDRVDADLVLRLTNVYPDGRSLILRDAALRLAARGGGEELSALIPGEMVEVDVDLGQFALVFNAWHRLRLSVASTNSPQRFANPNDGTWLGEDGTALPVVHPLIPIHFNEFRDGHYGVSGPPN
jgi:putative CocE/NonD family hydrolase